MEKRTWSLLWMLALAGCTDDVRRPYQELFEPVLDHLVQHEICLDGDWQNDFGDGGFYGPAFLVPWGLDKDRKDLLRLGWETVGFFHRLVETWREQPLVFMDAGDDLIMGALGAIYAYDRIPEICGQLRDCQIDQADVEADIQWSLAKWNGLIEAFDRYAPDMDVYAIRTYGNTTVTGLFGLLNAEWARVSQAGDAAACVEQARIIADAVQAKVWDQELQAFRFKPDDPDLYLYPNVVMAMLLVRLHELTLDADYLTRAVDLFDVIGSLKDNSQGSYRSPYSREEMGAETDDYKTLSSQCYTMTAAMLLHENTADPSYLDEVRGILDFIRDYLYDGQGKVLHHWMDGRLAVPDDLEYYCPACNLQLLFDIRYFWGL